MRTRLPSILFSFLLLLAGTQTAHARPAVPVGEPVIDPPTLRCLGVYWVIRDDDAHPAIVEVEYRKAVTVGWT